MKDLREELFKDLERYIEENWIPSPEEATEKKPSKKASLSSRPRPKTKINQSMVSDAIKPRSKGAVPAPRSSAADKHKPGGAPAPDSFSKGGPADGLRPPAVSLDDLIEEVGQSFHEALFQKVAESGMTDVEVYKRANIDRKLFSKIRNNPAYHPRKDTVLALAIALRLDIEQTEDLLARAEYALSPGSKSDVIIRYFIERKVYDIDTINIALYEHDLPALQQTAGG